MLENCGRREPHEIPQSSGGSRNHSAPLPLVYPHRVISVLPSHCSIGMSVYYIGNLFSAMLAHVSLPPTPFSNPPAR